MKKISIIVPIYNVYDYIERSLESLVPPSKYSSLVEVICVDDCTPDDSMKIVDQYIAKYPQVFRKIKNETNSKLGPTRINGAKSANGEFCFFLDSDDWVVDNFYEIVFRDLGKYGNNYDLIAYDFTWLRLNGDKQYCSPQKLSDNFKLYWNWEAHVFWNKLYKTNKVVNINCPPMTHEDLLSFPEVIEIFGEMKVVHENILWYLEREGSITTTISEEQKLQVKFDTIKHLIDMHGNNVEISQYLYANYFLHYDIINHYVSNYDNFPILTFIVECNADFHENFINVFNKWNLSKHPVEFIYYGEKEFIIDNQSDVSSKIKKATSKDNAKMMIADSSLYTIYLGNNVALNNNLWSLINRALYKESYQQFTLVDEFNIKMEANKITSGAKSYKPIKTPSKLERKIKGLGKKILWR